MSTSRRKQGSLERNYSLVLNLDGLLATPAGRLSELTYRTDMSLLNRKTWILLPSNSTRRHPRWRMVLHRLLHFLLNPMKASVHHDPQSKSADIPRCHALRHRCEIHHGDKTVHRQYSRLQTDHNRRPPQDQVSQHRPTLRVLGHFHLHNTSRRRQVHQQDKRLPVLVVSQSLPQRLK